MNQTLDFYCHDLLKKSDKKAMKNKKCYPQSKNTWLESLYSYVYYLVKTTWALELIKKEKLG